MKALQEEPSIWDEILYVGVVQGNDSNSVLKPHLAYCPPACRGQHWAASSHTQQYWMFGKLLQCNT